MGTFVEPAYIERLHEDIKIACGRLEEQGIETFVLAVSEDSHRLLGSQKGQLFLEEKYSVIAEFVQFCKDKRPVIKTEKQTITLFNEEGKSVKLQQSAVPDSIDPLETPALPDTDSILHTPAPPDNDCSLNITAPLVTESLVHDGGEDTDGYTEMFVTDDLDVTDEGFTKIKTDLSLKLPQNEETQSHSIKKKKKAVGKTKDSEKTSDASPRRTLRSGKSIQTSDIVENLPRVKVVLSKLKKAESSKKHTKTTNQTSKVANATKNISNKDKAEAICEKALSDSKSRTDSKQLVTPQTQPTKYLCRVCKDAFDTTEELKAHVALHKALACHMCKKVFKTKEGLEEHKQGHREKDEYHECKECDKVFKYTWQLGEHVEKVHETLEEEDGEYPCSRCGHVFRRKLHLEEHNERNASCAVEEMEVQKNTENVLLSEILFTDSLGLPKKMTVKELLENVKMPATCEICQKTFDKMYNFKRHILHHSEVKPHKCVTCGQCFQMEENLKKHLRLHELRPYYCNNENCFRRFESKTRLDHHFRFTCRKAENKPDLECQECGHKSQSVHAMETHKRTHTGIKAFSCEICGKQLATKESIGRHKLVFHQDEKPWECSQCGKRFKIRDTLKKHEKTHGERKFRCEICGKGCVESGNLKKHMMTHTKEKPFICDVCGKAYGRRSLLDNHQRLHTGEKPYTCDIEGCDKAFRSYGNLKQHKANHVQGHSFICDICGKTFKLKSRMNHHRKSHIVDYRWPCDYCEQKFKSIFMYKNHLAKTHPLMKQDIEERTNIRLYQCHICQKMYGDKEDLTRHVYIHMGLKPFKCKFCGKAFNDKSNMKCHERIHTGEKKLSCRLCYKTFLQQRPLRLHMKNVHGKTEEELDEQAEEEPGMKEENNYKVENSYKLESFTTDQECQTAVETVLSADSGAPLLLDMRTVSQAVIAEPSHSVIAQAYPTHSLAQSGHLFPQLVKEFEPLMIVENY